jgi:carboxyl-terminal processing protease
MKKVLLMATCAAIAFASTSFPAVAQEERTAGSKPTAAPSVSDSSETYKELSLFGDVFERVRDQYVDQVTDKQLVENALNGMLMALDPHSSYLNADDFEDMQVQTRGEFGGLGI